MEQVFIGLGSNLGERQMAINRAIAAVAGLSHVKLVQRASLYETEPVGDEAQPFFLNTVIEIQTLLHPRELLADQKVIERDIGRQQRGRWGPREIDLDILLYGTQVIDLPDLKIPHPELFRRGFVLVPLNELAPEAWHPIFGCTVNKLLQHLVDERGVLLFPSEQNAPSQKRSLSRMRS